MAATRRDRDSPTALPRGLVGAAIAAAALAATAVYVTRRARRAERAHPPQGDFVEVDGMRLHYLAGGDGRPVVLLHGNGAMAEDWIISDVFDRGAQSFRVFAFDRPGFGFSDRPRGRAWTPRAQAEILRAAFQRLGIERPIVVAHSWGGMVALELALAWPDEVAGLVLIGGYYFPTARADVPVFAAPAIPVLGDAMRYTLSPLLGRAMAGRIFKRVFAPRPVPWRFREEFPLSLALRPWQIRATAEDTAFMIPAAASLQRRYVALSAPMVVMAGDGDRLVDPARQSKRLHRHVPRSVLYMVPGGGHMLHYLVPSQVVDAIRAVAFGGPGARAEAAETGAMTGESADMAP